MSEKKTEDLCEDLAATMLATTLGIPFDAEKSWDEREQQYKLTGDIVNNSTNTQTINTALALQQNTTVNAASGNVALGGAVSGGFNLTKTGNSTLTLSGTATGPGGAAMGLRFTPVTITVQ